MQKKSKKKPLTRSCITENMYIAETVIKYPASVAVFARYGLHCIGCMGAQFDTIASGAAVHGINVAHLVHDLNTHVTGARQSKSAKR